MTGLNGILAKGENLLLSTPDILMRNRMSKLLWSSDISKLYNRLNLHPDHFQFSLFLYNPSLQPNQEPEVFVLTRAWYGVISSGNQAAVALKRLSSMYGDRYPEAVQVLDQSTYVDDMVDGTTPPPITPRSS